MKQANQKLAICFFAIVAFLQACSPADSKNTPNDLSGVRFAYSADGYNQDRDDVAGSAMVVALFDRAGFGDQLVHIHFNTNFGGPPKHADAHRKSVLETAVLFGMISDVGGDDGYFDVSESPEEKQAAIDHLANEIKKSTKNKPLWIFCAGGVQVPYTSLVKAVNEGASEKTLQSVTFISHGNANEKTANKDHENTDFHNNWDDLVKVSPYVNFIDHTSPLMNGRKDGGLNHDQNSTAWNQSPRTQHEGVAAWQWLEVYGAHVEGFGFSGTKGEWLLERLQDAGDPARGHNANAEGDASDAGMVFAMLPGGNSDANMEELHAYFLGDTDAKYVPAKPSFLNAVALSVPGIRLLCATSFPVEASDFYVNNEWLAVNPDQHKSATISKTYSSRDGVFDVLFLGVGEDDGASSYTLLVNKKQIGSFKNELSNITYEEGIKYMYLTENIAIAHDSTPYSLCFLHRDPGPTRLGPARTVLHGKVQALSGNVVPIDMKPGFGPVLGRW